MLFYIDFWQVHYMGVIVFPKRDVGVYTSIPEELDEISWNTCIIEFQVN